jgi:shikimate dehydrogenase
MTAAIHRFAVVGHPVQHSRSPIIHHAFAQQFGIDLSYEKIEAPINHFEATVEQFFKTGGHGLNITVPFKENAWRIAQNHLSARASLAGAVNTLWQVNEHLHGCNTDGVGLVNDLKRLGVKLNGARIMMVGAGGAARGVMQPLLDAGCAHLHIVNRTETRAHELSALCLSHLANHPVQSALTSRSSHPPQPDPPGALEPLDQPRITAGSLADAKLGAPWSLVINASSSGLSNQAPDLPAGLYTQGAWAYDMMYGANPTAFMMQAKQTGASNQADGLGMLVGQAAESFYIWHGVKPDPLPVIELLRNTFKMT